MKQNWLVASDIHGDAKLWYRLIDTVKDTDTLDAVIVCGDLTNMGLNSLTYISDVSLAEECLMELAELIPTYYILGNHDLGISGEYFADTGAIHLTDTPIEIGGLKVVGVNLSTCFNMPTLALYWRNMASSPEIDFAAFEALPSADVVVSHSPPFGLQDTCLEGHKGSPGLREYIGRVQPKLVLCGHVHEAKGATSEGDTRVFNLARTMQVIEV